MKAKVSIVLGCIALGSVACARSPAIEVGALYPTGGSQGEGGIAEARGVRLAAEFVNDAGGVGGREIRLVSYDVPSADAAPHAVQLLAERKVPFVLGAYGSTISRVAAAEAARRGMLYWETGAVGEMTGDGAGDLVFRVSPTGAVLGRSAVGFIAEQLAPRLARAPHTLRFAVSNVDDVYGNAVARGAVEEINARGLPFAGAFAYPARGADIPGIVRAIARAKPDVLFVSAYLEDAVALRREMVKQHVRLLASIGTSSSYCMEDFGEALGAAATGLFASDKPDALLNPSGLQPGARTLLARANAAYRNRYHEEMDPPALAGFSAAWALFRDVMPRARTLAAREVAAAARAASMPSGSLPNGSGLAFGAPGKPDAGANVRAASVIWEWVRSGERAVVWPPQYATQTVELLPLAA